MHLLVEGEPLVNPTAGIIYAASQEIYRVVGKYAFLMTDADAKGHPDYGPPDHLFRRASSDLIDVLYRIIQPFDYGDFNIVCNRVFNPPELVKRGKICVLLRIKPRLTAEYYSDRFILGRFVDSSGQTFMTVKGIPSDAANHILPSDRL